MRILLSVFQLLVPLISCLSQVYSSCAELGIAFRQESLEGCSLWGCRVGHDWATELSWTDCDSLVSFDLERFHKALLVYEYYSLPSCFLLGYSSFGVWVVFPKGWIYDCIPYWSATEWYCARLRTHIWRYRKAICPTLAKWKLLSHVQLFATSWTTAHQALLSTEFSRQEYWSG